MTLKERFRWALAILWSILLGRALLLRSYTPLGTEIWSVLQASTLCYPSDEAPVSSHLPVKTKRKESALLEGARIQARTIHALMVRDMMMRYGRDNIGFVWVILEPMILCVGVMSIWSVMGHESNGVKIVELVLTGYMPLTLWRHLTGPVVNMFRNSAPVLYHRKVSLLDLVLARQLLETIGTTAALLVVYTTLNLAEVVDDIRRWDLVVLGWLMMAWIGTSCGMLMACVTERYEVAERFVQPLQYLNIPISGCFFFVDWLPTWGQQIIMYHPLVHCYEVFRAGYFGEAVVTHYSISYFTVCAFIFTYLGLVWVRGIRAYVRLN
jgi:capsular polysaccharide transport system permease protein